MLGEGLTALNLFDALLPVVTHFLDMLADECGLARHPGQCAVIGNQRDLGFTIVEVIHIVSQILEERQAEVDTGDATEGVVDYDRHDQRGDQDILALDGIDVRVDDAFGFGRFRKLIVISRAGNGIINQRFNLDCTFSPSGPVGDEAASFVMPCLFDVVQVHRIVCVWFPACIHSEEIRIVLQHRSQDSVTLFAAEFRVDFLFFEAIEGVGQGACRVESDFDTGLYVCGLLMCYGRCELGRVFDGLTSRVSGCAGHGQRREDNNDGGRPQKAHACPKGDIDLDAF